MAKDYFSHDYNSRNDTKLTRLFMKHQLKGLGAYWCIVEMLYEEGGYLLRSEYERISFELRTDYEFIENVIEDFDLFVYDEERFWSETALERLKLRAEKSKKARESIEKRWAKHKRNTNVKQSNNERNTSKVKESKVKEKKINIPLFEEFKSYALENEPLIDTKELKLKYEAWAVNGWKDGNNKKITNWKSKILNTIPHISKVKASVNTIWEQKNNQKEIKY